MALPVCVCVEGKQTIGCQKLMCQLFRKVLIFKWFLKDAIKVVEIITKDLEYYINFVDKAAASFERTISNFKKVPLWVKCHQIASRAKEKLSVKGSTEAANFIVV